MNISEKEKVDILLSAVEERYNAMHKIRERVQSIGLWSLGILFSAGGWIIENKVSFNLAQTAIIVIGILIASGILRFIYLEDLHRGFRGQQRVAARIEKSLGLFKPKIFDESEDPIYPPSWEKSGTHESDGKFFYTTYILLYMGVIFLVIAILLNGHILNHSPSKYNHYNSSAEGYLD